MCSLPVSCEIASPLFLPRRAHVLYDLLWFACREGGGVLRFATYFVYRRRIALAGLRTNTLGCKRFICVPKINRSTAKMLHTRVFLMLSFQ